MITASGAQEFARHVGSLLVLLGRLGTSTRALRAWLGKHRDTIAEKAFAGQRTVIARTLYVDVGHERELTNYLIEGGKTGGFLWITGSGGCGKTTHAIRVGQEALRREMAIPVFVDNTWRMSLEAHVALLLKVEKRRERPTTEMVAKMLETGMLMVIVDGLTEIQRPGAFDDLMDLYQSGRIKWLVVTARPTDVPVEGARIVETGLLGGDVLDAFVKGYAPANRQDDIIAAMRIFSRDRHISPLIAKLAIAEFAKSAMLPESSEKLVENYLLGARASSAIALTESDHLRACTVAARACLAETFHPHDVAEESLRLLLATEHASTSFTDGRGNATEPTAVVNQLVQAGILQRQISALQMRVDFTHHPIAEMLMAMSVQRSEKALREKLTNDILGAASASPTLQRLVRGNDAGA